MQSLLHPVHGTPFPLLAMPTKNVGCIFSTLRPMAFRFCHRTRSLSSRRVEVCAISLLDFLSIFRVAKKKTDHMIAYISKLRHTVNYWIRIQQTKTSTTNPTSNQSLGNEVAGRFLALFAGASSVQSVREYPARWIRYRNQNSTSPQQSSLFSRPLVFFFHSIFVSTSALTTCVSLRTYRNRVCLSEYLYTNFQE